MSAKKLNSGFFQSLFGPGQIRQPRHLWLITGIHILAWSAFFLLPLLIYPFRYNIANFLERELADKLMLVAFFYLFYYLLIPRLFERKQYYWFAAATLLLFLIYLFVLIQTRPRNVYINRQANTADSVNVHRNKQTAGRRFIISKQHDGGTNVPVRQLNIVVRDAPFPNDSLQNWLPPDFLDEPRQWMGIPLPFLAMVFNRASTSFLLILLLAGFIRLSFSFIRNQNEKKVLENAQLNAEVDLLKSQINPHFLFNTLNSIYSQAHARSENTEHSILKLSELLRYVLYESSAREVPLANDIQYIRNYIELQRLRLSNRVTIDFRVQGDLNHLSIAPMLLISFIENAFKHGISYSQASIIQIQLTVENNRLTMAVINPMIESEESGNTERGGLGLPNVTRRLAILYPGRHQLTVRRENQQHIVQLTLNLAHD